MGIVGDILQGQVVLKYKADISDAEVNLRKLSGVQKQQAKDAVQGVKDQLEAHERLAKQIAVGMAAVAGVVYLGVSAFKAYDERIRLTTASSGANMDALRKASHGLLTDLDLMRLAAEGMNGRFKLTSEQMENVLGAAVALERRGLGPLHEIAQKLGEAVKKGEVDPLKDLGIAYDEQLAKYDKRSALLRSLATLSKDAAAGTETETEALRRHATEAENYYDRAKAGAAQVGMEAVAGLVILNDKVLAARKSIHDFFVPGEETTWGGLMVRMQWKMGLDGLQAVIDKLHEMQSAADAAAESYSRTNEHGGRAVMGRMLEAGRQRGQAEANVDYLRGARLKAQNDRVQAQYDASAARAAANQRRNSGGRGRGDGESQIIKAAKAWLADQIPPVGSYEWQLLQVYIKQQEGREDLDFGDLGTEGIDALLGGGVGKRGPRRDAAGFSVGKDGKAYGIGGAKQPSFMEKMLGSVEQFDAYATAWGGFQNAVTSGYEALVTGSESFGAAAKKVIGQTIMAEGSHMLVLALREGAMAIASLAGGHFAAAGTHALAAAKFGAGAAIAGVVAHSLGAGGSTGSGGSGGSAPGGGAPSNDNIPRNTTVVLGHGWDDETPRYRAAKVAKANRMAASYESAPVGVGYY